MRMTVNEAKKGAWHSLHVFAQTMKGGHSMRFVCKEVKDNDYFNVYMDDDGKVLVQVDGQDTVDIKLSLETSNKLLEAVNNGQSIFSVLQLEFN